MQTAICAPDSGHVTPPAIAQAAASLQQGNLPQSLEVLKAAAESIASPDDKARAEGALGASYLKAQQYESAEFFLKKAYTFFSGSARAAYAVSLGNLAMVRKQDDLARHYYQEALGLAGDDTDLAMSTRLNMVRLAPADQRFPLLVALSRQLAALDGHGDLARLHLNLGNQARLLGTAATELSYRELARAGELALKSRQHRLRVEVLDATAQLYEERGRLLDALRLTQQGLEIALAQDHATVADLLINLEWRQGRLFNLRHEQQLALAAYQRALSYVELVRQDIPVVYEDGRSSFRATLEPIYLGFVDLQLKELDRRPADPQSARLRTVVDTLELIKQTELQDFLGDRCAVETVQGGNANQIPAATAVLYPVILPDRMELLLRTSNGIVRTTVALRSDVLAKAAASFAADLRAGARQYLKSAQQLYAWLLRPVEQALSEQQIHSIIVVPDGVLRLVPMAALHDGRNFAIEKYAISMVTGLSVTNTAHPLERNVAVLLAGVAEPGVVVDKLGPVLEAQILGTSAAAPDGVSRSLAGTRSLRAIKAETASEPKSDGKTPRKLDDLRERLALPGVKDEIESLRRILGGTRLLDAEFTVEHFGRNVESGEYRVVHLASHGVFGGTPETSYIMAHDDIITMNGLQSLLKSEKFQKNPIELLTLSACQTAEGNDRAPLGISGAAIKARAKSVLGTLWPVDDDAARAVMEVFYAGLMSGKLSKAEALRQAQMRLIRKPDSGHPFFWAPFVLIGNWL